MAKNIMAHLNDVKTHDQRMGLEEKRGNEAEVFTLSEYSGEFSFKRYAALALNLSPAHLSVVNRKVELYKVMIEDGFPVLYRRVVTKEDKDLEQYEDSK